MKYLQTFWTGPSGTDKENLITMKAGWRSCEYHWMSWALSCLLAKDMFGDIHLVTDLKGKEILVDRLQLPYSTVSAELENRLANYNPHLWALAKIYTYSIQTEPFLHLDGDVFLWQRPGAELLNSPLIAQNLDKDLAFYTVTLDKLNECFCYIPDEFKKANYENKTLYASNAGLLGGHDLNFFKLYCAKAFDLVDRNTDALDKLPPGNLNFIFEQFLFCKLAEIQQIPVAYLKGVVDDPVFKDYIKFEDYPNVQMVHPVGGFKKYPHVCEHVAKMLRSRYPEYYYRIIEMVRNNTSAMRSTVYYSPGLKLDALPLSPTRQTIGPPLFARTKAAINYLEKKYDYLKHTEFADDGNEDDLLNLPLVNDLTENEKARLLEILHLELRHKSLLKKYYGKQAGIQKLYTDDVEAHKQTQAVFSLKDAEILNIEVIGTKKYTLIELNCPWEYNHPDEIPGVIERNLNEPESPVSVLLLPDILTMNVKEYYLDDIDGIIFSMVKSREKISYILEEIKEYFTEDEIENDYESYQKLIFDSLKHLLYTNILCVY
ncbi:DUF6734 family protein [Mucilaginibacter ginsenosidivorans]|uniref:DUF6734 domain-containing protein n=1 Tax=Mucilaginibacter ginsenosidivorans TaxID=398053 RepID=A0A5B8UUR1_9SPHI|nr:DUF6734 family protein [Mucilaginibacter ginsenosidivorans]QEC62857.1 hypothetical protein FRZ54_09795 [Mucilaginibacter ginsenosidivorans]